MKLIIPPSWDTFLKNETSKPYFFDLEKKLSNAYKTQGIYPTQTNIFNALELTPLETVKVVILGQDPYHGPNQAHGLAFSVQADTPVPPSLKNIYKEIATDIGGDQPTVGTLTHLATQGVLLLNTTLTVEAGQAGSHQGWGWETFTDEVIRVISREQKNVVFLLWGKHAEAKSVLIDHTKHLILTAPHPSPLSAYRGFLGCQHFSQTNTYLRIHAIEAIDWHMKDLDC